MSLPPATTDSLLLVKPEVASKQIEEESAPKPSAEHQLAELVEQHGAGQHDPSAPKVDIVFPRPKTRFCGVKTLNSHKIAMGFKNIADEILANLRADDGTSAVVDGPGRCCMLRLRRR